MTENMMREIRKLRDEAVRNSLALLFTDWEIKILEKKVANKPLTDSERVEYSRHIKKVIQAIDILQDLRHLLR